MSKEEERKIISELLELYPDVVSDLGGESIINSESILEKIGDYIEKHKWLVNENIPYTITITQAFFSWHENVFIPQWNEMVKTNIVNILDHLTPYEVFNMVSDEYFFLQEKESSSYYNKACYNTILRESKSGLSKFIAKMNLLFLK